MNVGFQSSFSDSAAEEFFYPLGGVVFDLQDHTGGGLVVVRVFGPVTWCSADAALIKPDGAETTAPVCGPSTREH